MNKIAFTAKAIKNLKQIDQRYYNIIKQKILTLAEFPNVDLDIKKLHGQPNKYRMRVGRYRVLFEVIDGQPKIIEIQAIAKRDERTYTTH